jgi:hypothetical protein
MHAYLCLTAGTLASIWVVSLVQSATRRLFEAAADLDVLQTHNRETRNVLAMMAFARLIGVEAMARHDDGRSALLEALRDVPDYNDLCVETINLLFSATNLERLMDIGDVAGFASFSEPVTAVNSIRALFGWT